MGTPLLFWILFNAFVLVMLALDLGVFQRKSHEVSTKEALTWIGTLVPLGYFIGKTYPSVINYSAYILVLFVVIASLPMLKILFTKKSRGNSTMK